MIDEQQQKTDGNKLEKNQQKRKQLKHKDEEKSFWHSWFSFGSDSDTDSDDEKTKKVLKNKKLANDNQNSSPSNDRESVTMSTRKSSACAFHNFNLPHPNDEKNVKRSAERTLR